MNGVSSNPLISSGSEITFPPMGSLSFSEVLFDVLPKLVTNRVFISWPPKAGIVGRFIGTIISLFNSPQGEIRKILPPSKPANQ